MYLAQQALQKAAAGAVQIPLIFGTARPPSDSQLTFKTSTLPPPITSPRYDVGYISARPSAGLLTAPANGLRTMMVPAFSVGQFKSSAKRFRPLCWHL